VGGQAFTQALSERRLGTGLLADVEQLANLGWGEWDLLTGEVYWSPQLYRIYQRDPGLGPLTHAEGRRMVVDGDRSLRDVALAASAASDRIELFTRVRMTVRDADGRPVRLFGIIQDVTEQQVSYQRLAEVEHELAEQRRATDAEHDLALRLQEIILPIPDEPIELPGLKAAVRYLPAGQETMVGGDWFHAAPLRDGTVLLAIGDVAGHGTQAASNMAQLRHALRALTVVDSDPATLLRHLNRLTCELERETPELAATAVIARFDPVRYELTWAQAGHPPPLLCRNGRTAPLARPAGPMLGVMDDARYDRAVTSFHPGDVLLLYTDGLVEHRGQSLDTGLDAVVAAVDDAVRTAPHQPLAELVGRLRRANPDDDTCILAVRPSTGSTRDLRHLLGRI
jgi:serine phosphatase RsbU (regulator of sigma subunit)